MSKKLLALLFFFNDIVNSKGLFAFQQDLNKNTGFFKGGKSTFAPLVFQEGAKGRYLSKPEDLKATGQDFVRGYLVALQEALAVKREAYLAQYVAYVDAKGVLSAKRKDYFAAEGAFKAIQKDSSAAQEAL